MKMSHENALSLAFSGPDRVPVFLVEAVVPSCTYDTLDMNSLARADGFVNWTELAVWFEKTHGLDFNGLLIRWEAPQE